MTTGCKVVVSQRLSDELRSHHLYYFNPHVCVGRDWGQLGVDPNRTGFARPVATFAICGHKRQRSALDLRSEAYLNASCRARTCDPWIKSPLLYQLS